MLRLAAAVLVSLGLMTVPAVADDVARTFDRAEV